MTKKITFVPEQKEVTLDGGRNLLQAAAKAGIMVQANCAGKGTCGKCKVRVVSGYGGGPTAADLKHLTAKELAEGWVLACQHEAETDMVVEIPLQKDAHARKSGMTAGNKLKVDSGVKKTYLELQVPNIDDQLSDLDRLKAELKLTNPYIDLAVLTDLSRRLRRFHFKVTAVTVNGQLVAVEEGDTTDRKYGVVFDVGTTTVVGFLLDLNGGEVIATAARTNPQNFFGADVISRINHVSQDPDGLHQLQHKVIEAANEIIAQLYQTAGVAAHEVYEAVVVGNTTMSHLFLGIDPTYLAPAPFIPVFTQAVEIEARSLGLNILPTGRVMMLPNIAGYVGSDTVGVMLATHIDQREGYTVAVDIGTNGEVVLAGNGRILTCSTAAGPAFEGAQIQNGMRAADGAIEVVTIRDGKIAIEVIGNTRPIGICGSGLIDAIAEMYGAGILNASGRFADPENPPASLHPDLLQRIVKGNHGLEFILVREDESATGDNIVVSQKDVRELQLGKGAIYAGVQIMLKMMGITTADITQFLVAGAFGSYIKTESALAIGLFPPLPPAKILSVGNAAGDGGKLALVSKKERASAVAMAKQAEHIELSTRMDFQDEFVSALGFPEQ